MATNVLISLGEQKRSRSQHELPACAALLLGGVRPQDIMTSTPEPRPQTGLVSATDDPASTR